MLTSEIVTITDIGDGFVHYVDSRMNGAWAAKRQFPNVRVGQTWVVVYIGQKIITTAIIPGFEE